VNDLTRHSRPDEGGPPAGEAGARQQDVRLVRGVLQRDQQALSEIYTIHADACFGLARRVLGDRTLAEEIVQEVFVRLWNAADRFDAERGSLRAYLLAQVHGRSVDLLRAETARRNREERDARRTVAESDDFERQIIDLAQAEAVRDALNTLSPGEREAIELAYFGGHSYREVALLLEQPEGTIKSRIRAGLLRLRAALIDAGYSTL
jgi:RNA polymerase sigma-70 factor (ECF subfamily)